MDESRDPQCKPGIITETDLLSHGNPQYDNIPDKLSDQRAIADSLHQFFYEEWYHGGSADHYGRRPHIALWLINDNITSVNNLEVDPNNPKDGDELKLIDDDQHEHDWHEAYKDALIDETLVYTETAWFVDWYTRSELWQPELRLFLGGALDSSSLMMADTLRSGNYLPTIEPYSSLGYHHVGGGGGEVVEPGVFAITGVNAIVDWVVLELRDAADPSVVVATQSALLQRDGDIVGMDGVRVPYWKDVSGTHFYLAVRHRNHLGVMTANPVALATIPTVDFTDTALPTYGTHAQQIFTLSNGVVDVRGLWAGNTNGDNMILLAGPNNDQTGIVIAVVTSPGYVNGPDGLNHIAYGYQRADLNLDGRTILHGPNNDVNVLLTTIFTHPGNSSDSDLLSYSHNFIVDEQLP